ncbi:MAG: glycerophosphodiester phosphodiesterase [Candidatus Omnitrophica bacterium]|nr:glycerophosphodiester phosphodiesterase [Candidatus Omnitrophota bacterium]
MKIIAHRGASAELPENTLEAFDRALEIGVDGIELDVLLSKDGRMVVRHDDLIEVNGQWHYVNELTLQQLQQIDLRDGARIPSLEEVLDRFHGRVPLTLDLKALGVTEVLVPVLESRKAGPEIHVTSFLHGEIVQMAEQYPAVMRSIVLAAVPIRFRELFEDTQTKQVSLFRGYVSREGLAGLQKHGVSIWIYPVNMPREAQTFAGWGVDAIFTDDPAGMKQFLITP